MAALIDRMDVVGIAGGAAACTVVLQMIDRPGPGEIVSLKWGAWIALAGALAIVGASRMGAKRQVAAQAPPPDWTKPSAPLVAGRRARALLRAVLIQLRQLLQRPS